MRYCKICGNKLENDARFCDSCGAELFDDENNTETSEADKVYEDVLYDMDEESTEEVTDSSEKPYTGNEPDAPDEDFGPGDVYTETSASANQSEPKKSKGPLIAGMLAAIIVIAAVIAVVVADPFGWFDKKAKDTDTETTVASDSQDASEDEDYTYSDDSDGEDEHFDEDDEDYDDSDDEDSDEKTVVEDSDDEDETTGKSSSKSNDNTSMNISEDDVYDIAGKYLKATYQDMDADEVLKYSAYDDYYADDFEKAIKDDVNEIKEWCSKMEYSVSDFETISEDEYDDFWDDYGDYIYVEDSSELSDLCKVKVTCNYYDLEYEEDENMEFNVYVGKCNGEWKVLTEE